MVRETPLRFSSHTLPYRGREFSTFKPVHIRHFAFALSLRLSTATRSALVLPVQTGKIRGSTVRRDVGIAPYEILSVNPP